MNNEIHEEVMPTGKLDRLGPFEGITPIRAVRRRCLDCSAYVRNEVRDCDHTDCILLPYRMGKGRVSLKEIKAYCKWCQGGDIKGVKSCPDGQCSLFPFRLGKNPNYSEESRETFRKLLNKRQETKQDGSVAVKTKPNCNL